ncbi:MAG TPA: SDR family NAD(P)-dependent oxidoreductase, partial [Limnobacter sp.]|nr:SDR family NAD(P)-dependent oxidoreductase [Limnobacter sp.]
MIKAVVTGHSQGLGLALARALLQQGVPVLGIARGQATLGELAADGHLQQVPLNLADTQAVLDWLGDGELVRFFEGANQALLINNAGVVSPVGPMAVQSVMDVANAVSLNVAAPLMLSAAVAQLGPHISDRRILHVSSGAGRSAYPGWSVYCATKAALDMHAQSA